MIQEPNTLKEPPLTLREQADALLREKGILSLLQSTGTVYTAGSYALDLMTWRDLDLQLEPKAGLEPAAIYLFLLSALSADSDLREAKFFRFLGAYKPHYPRGHAFNFMFETPQWGGIWKLDLWLFPSEEIERQQRYLKQLQTHLTPETRALILRLKEELMRPTGRVPKMGSHFLYRAVLLEGLRDPKAILEYLKSQGVSLKDSLAIVKTSPNG